MMETRKNVLPENACLHFRYQVKEALGAGGFGITYAAQDIKLHSRVTIKELFVRGYMKRESSGFVVCRNADQRRIGNAKQKFRKEAKLIGYLYGAPGVVKIRDYFEENNTAYMVMDYLDGISLEEYFAQNGPIKASRLIPMLFPLMETLDIIHRFGIIHRDISPDNIMILKNGKVKLIDFGTAGDFGNRDFSNRNFSNRNFKDTASEYIAADESDPIELKHGYAPLEQYGRGIQGAWTDIYAVCAVLYQGLTGLKPVSSVMRSIHDELQMPSELGIPIDARLEQILEKGLSVRPQNRYQTVRAMLEDIEMLVKELQVG